MDLAEYQKIRIAEKLKNPPKSKFRKWKADFFKSDGGAYNPSKAEFYIPVLIIIIAATVKLIQVIQL